MPIKPENKKRYPKNWKAIRQDILIRAKNKCEFCGIENYAIKPNGAKVVLTIAHLDHTPENCDYSNLRALCQKCHNQYDARHRVETRKNHIKKEQITDCVLLAIHSEYANKIYQGIKKWEFRRVVPVKFPKRILLYETSPVCKITGIVDVVSIPKLRPDYLWELTREYAGIKRNDFFEYFNNCETCYAFELKNPHKFNKSLTLKDVGVARAPQSFQYIDFDNFCGK